MSDQYFGNPELWDEYQWERFLQEQDQKSEQYFKLYEKFSDHPDRDHLIAQEMGWDSADFASNQAEMEEWIDAMDAADELDLDQNANPNDLFTADQTSANPEDADDDTDAVLASLEHSEVYRLGLELNKMVYDLFDANDHFTSFDIVGELSEKSSLCSAKMAAALCGSEFSEVGMTIAYLKRSLKAAHESLTSVEALHESGELDSGQVGKFRTILFAIREKLVDHMHEFRTELSRRRGEH